MLTEGNDIFHQEKEDIVDAGSKAGLYQQMDDTGSRVNGKNHYTVTFRQGCVTSCR